MEGWGVIETYVGLPLVVEMRRGLLCVSDAPSSSSPRNHCFFDRSSSTQDQGRIVAALPMMRATAPHGPACFDSPAGDKSTISSFAKGSISIEGAWRGGVRQRGERSAHYNLVAINSAPISPRGFEPRALSRFLRDFVFCSVLCSHKPSLAIIASSSTSSSSSSSTSTTASKRC